MPSSKKCFKCGNDKPLNEFYKHPEMADGYLGKCKLCAKKDVTENRLKNLDRIRAYDRDRSKNPERIKLATEYTKRWREEDRRRQLCHSKVAQAIRNGAIERLPCEVCGDKKTIAHHDSYDKPLYVRWFCQIHHKEHHKIMAIEGIIP